MINADQHVDKICCSLGVFVFRLPSDDVIRTAEIKCFLVNYVATDSNPMTKTSVTIILNLAVLGHTVVVQC